MLSKFGHGPSDISVSDYVFFWATRLSVRNSCNTVRSCIMDIEIEGVVPRVVYGIAHKGTYQGLNNEAQ